MSQDLKFFSRDSRELAISFTSCLFVLLLTIPPWAQVNFLVLFAWRAIADLSDTLNLPPRWVTNTLAFITVVLIKWQFGEFGSKEATTAFLILLTALKILEMRTRWDFNFVLLLGLVLMPLQFIWTIDIWILIPTLISLILLLWAWIKRDETGQLVSFKIPISYFTRMLAFSVPIAALLFLFFPRAHSPFGLTQNSTVGTSGFSGELNPGSVSELVKTSELAFRARFFDKNPHLVNMYWVGEMLTESNDGLRWEKGSIVDETDLTEATAGTPSYELTLEPQGKRWLFALEKTTSLKVEKVPNAKRWPALLPSSGGVFKSPLAFTKTQSYLAYKDPNLKRRPKVFDPFLMTPQLSPRVLQWIQSKRNIVTSPETALRIIYNEFSQGKFVYTLEPGTPQLTFEQFFFETRKGFCEHFAGVTATLLRGLGVPARVIVGYQGGAYNRFGNFWSVTQGDAHAWVEYVNSEGYWQRTDPVQVVAPLRTNLGALTYFQLPEDIRQSLASNWTPPQDFTFRLRDSWDLVQSYFENLNYQWMQFLLDFNQDSQKSFLYKILEQAHWILTGVVLLIAGIMGVRRIRKSPDDQSMELYDNFIEWAAKQGLQKTIHEGPVDFSMRVKNSLPAASDEVDSIIRSYIHSRYEKSQPTPDDLAKAKSSFKRLRKSQYKH